MRVWVLFVLCTLSVPVLAEKPVILFSQTYCPSCLAAKQFFEKEQIPYKEFDIETSPIALEYFEKLGGRGTPLIYVDGKRIEGFNRRRVMELSGHSSSAGSAAKPDE